MGTNEGLRGNSNGRRPYSVERVTQLLRHAGSPVPRSADRTQLPLPPTPNQFISNLRGLSYQQSRHKQQGHTHRTDNKNKNLILCSSKGAFSKIFHQRFLSTPMIKQKKTKIRYFILTFSQWFLQKMKFLCNKDGEPFFRGENVLNEASEVGARKRAINRKQCFSYHFFFCLFDRASPLVNFLPHFAILMLVLCPGFLQTNTSLQ